MTDELCSLDVPLVLHVIPSSRARGAQREARALADRLDRPGVRAHRVLSLSEGPDEVRVDATLPHRGDGAPTVGFDPRLALTLRAGLRRMDPDVVVAHGSEPLKYLVPSLVGRRRPLAYYAIGTYSGSDRAAQLALWRLLVRHADVVAAEGEEVRDECIDRLAVPPSRVVLTPNGRDPEEFRPRPPVDTGPPTALFVGALTEGKGPDRFIEMVAALRSRGIALQADMVGDGPLAGGLRGVAEAAGVAPDVPGVRSIVQDGRTGLVVPVDDPGALATATARLLGDAALRRSMGEAARRHCRDHFSLDAVADRWLSLLEPLLASAARRNGNGSAL